MNTNKKPAHHLNHLMSAQSAIMSLALCAGLCVAQDSGSVPTQSGSASGSESSLSVDVSPKVFNRSELRSLESAFEWFDRDSSILRTQIEPRTPFIEYPGLKERSSYLNVKIKTQEQMIEQIAREFSISPAAQTLGVENHNEPNAIQALLDSRVIQAQTRLLEARTRINPSMHRAFDDVNMHSIKVPNGVSAEHTAEALMLTGDYEFVSMDWICYPTDTTPNDPLFSTQWHHDNDRIDSVGAWDVLQGSSSTIIGVVDSGVDLDHPDLAASLVPGYNAVDDLAQANGGNVNDHVVGHGSLVAGAAAAIGNNGTGVSGVGWNFGIMPIKVSNNNSGTAALSAILAGARWASDNGAYVANCSFGGAEDPATWSTGGHIRQEGHHLVFAAGNDGLANQTNDWESVTIVGASNTADNWASWSHTGIGIDCIAPGVSIRSTNRVGGYSYTTGTSFSAPITSGAIMLVHDANPSLDPAEVEFILLNSCDDFLVNGQDNQTGWGRINVSRAVNDAIHGPSITSLPFSEDFAEDSLSSEWRNPVGDVDVSSNGSNIPSGLYALNLDDSDSIETISMRAAELGGLNGEIRFAAQHRGPESGETLTIEYYNLLSSWVTLDTIESDGSLQDDFVTYRYAMPAFGNHDEFKLRFSVNGSDTSDDWYIDDILVQEFTSNPVPWVDTFEDGITLTLDWANSQGEASEDALNEPSGSQSALLVNQETMTSAEVDLNTAPSLVYVHFYSQHNGVENGEQLEVEYRAQSGVWKSLVNVDSDGTDQTSFELTQLPIPFDAYGGATALRFSAQGDQADDAWFIDNVAITTELIDEETCEADLTDDGMLNFFDISAFLSAFNSQDPIADFTGDGVYNFFDVSAFLSAFNAGCP